MIAVEFDEANIMVGPPPDMSESQVRPMAVYKGKVETPGSLDGISIVIAAWKPDTLEIERIRAGAYIYLTVLGERPPAHLLTTDFDQARNLT